jgi:hypothetical protein
MAKIPVVTDKGLMWVEPRKKASEAVERLYIDLDDAIYDKMGERVELEDDDRGVEIVPLFELDDEE